MSVRVTGQCFGGCIVHPLFKITAGLANFQFVIILFLLMVASNNAEVPRGANIYHRRI